LKIAIIGSRGLECEELGLYIPKSCNEIVSGGAKGIDTCAKKYAIAHNILISEFLPEYEKFGRAAPIMRNKQIVDYADKVLAFWDGKSKGTKSVIEYCKKTNKAYEVILLE
jgi:predicted Rossmann fold nucleotide-binding protein DprA/Smf involved in DNA uptake